MNCLIKLDGEPTLQAPLRVETVRELISYALGFYASLFAGAEPKYPEQSRARFIYTVLKEGYHVPLATGMSDDPEINLEALRVEGTESAQLDHSDYRDPHAWKLMTSMFLATLEGN